MFRCLIMTLAILGAPVLANANSVKVIEAYESRCYSGDEINQELIEGDLSTLLTAQLYRMCVDKVKNQDNCEILGDTFGAQYLYDTYIDGAVYSCYSGKMLGRYDKSTAEKGKVFSAGGFWLFWNDSGAAVSEAEIRTELLEKVTTDAMNACIKKMKTADKCFLQEKTFSYKRVGQIYDPNLKVVKQRYHVAIFAVGKN